ncbi:MAG TPA: hypothetical protein VIG99_16680 [Myxococcaceae bacterium]|jgi:S-DNA-T family DNA segregation ATPase FtsK/SpoIIIE
MGAVPALLLAAAFAAAPAPDAFRLDGPAASATVDGAPAAVVRKKEAAAPRPRPETREERLSRRPTPEELWDSGASMIVWREERAPAPGGSPTQGSAATSGQTGASVPGGATQESGTTREGAYASREGALGPAEPSAPGGAQGAEATREGVLGPAEPEASSGAAPQGSAAVSGQTGASEPGAAPISGGAYTPVAATAPESMTPGPAGSTAYGPAPSAPAYGSPPIGPQTILQQPPPLLAIPATPLTAPIQYETGQNGGTIGNGLIGGGGLGAAAVYGGSGVTTGIFNQATPPPSGVFSGTSPTSAPTMATPPTPPVLNSASPVVPGGGPTVLPPTPQPLNAQPAPIPGATAPVPTQLPSQTQLTPGAGAPPIQMRSTPAAPAPGIPGSAVPAIPAAPATPAAPGR